ncbi:pentapeptide repeat-containing protein [Streptomyces lavenduligriseus]|nr:pentapeptide repeat-containing protein [Streptomyces lavenduligriseus]
MKLIASNVLTERLGGIYALERIMRDSERDHNTVVEVLSAFIRENGRNDAAHGQTSEGEGEKERDILRGQLREDLQAALVVLGRRPERELLEEEGGLERVNLNRTDLRGAELYNHSLSNVEMREARLDDAQLFRVDLSGAELQESSFAGADFCWADLSIASLAGANLQNARLHGARLEYATLWKVDFTGADMAEACLKEANLKEAKLDGARALTLEQVMEARIFQSTKLPSQIRQDKRVMTRIEQCEVEEAARQAALRSRN